MRILLAHDLSAASELAVSLIAHAKWPASSVARVVSSPIGIGLGLSSFANLRESRAHARQVRQAITFAHERVTADLHDAGLEVETGTLRGRPERAIVAEAARFDADVIAVGARRQESVVATLLGSVSRAVVEDAPCSVLVARGTTARRVLVATDGSEPAALATTIVASWPMFAGAQIRLVVVQESPPRYASSVLSDAERRSTYRETIAAATDRARDVVVEAVSDLIARGRRVDSEIRFGDVGTELVEAGRAWPADMTVVGSTGEPFMKRLLLGSVAQKVLDGVASSVLVARPRHDGRRAD